MNNNFPILLMGLDYAVHVKWQLLRHLNVLIMVKSEKAANRVMESITKKLWLKVNVEKSKVARPDKYKIPKLWILQEN